MLDEWGGYLIAALPEYRVFIDGRGLDEGAQVKYNLILYGSAMKYAGKEEWESLLDSYGINTVLLPPYDSNTGERIRLVELLLQHAGWKRSFFDGKSIIFLRTR